MQPVYLSTDKNYIIETNLLSNNSQCDWRSRSTRRRTLYLAEGRIAAVAQAGDTQFTFSGPNRETVVLDWNRLTVLPPPVDCHVHLALDGVDFAAARRRWESPGEITAQVQNALRDTLRHGILAVRDGGDRAGIALRFRNLVTGGAMTGPVVRASGFALRKPGKYGSFLGRGIPAGDLDSALDNLVAHGVNQVKVIVSGVVSFTEYGQVGALQYTTGELAALVQGAHDRGLPVMAHASSDAAVAMAVRAGVDTVEHGYFLTRNTLELMAEKGTAWVPTVIPVAAQLRNRAGNGPDRAQRYVIEKTVDRQLAMINEAAALGVTLGVGTDAGAAGVRHGYGYLDEIALYRQAGLSPAQILQCVTVNGARILGLDWGRIEAGRPAALIAVEGDPLREINALRNVQYVIVNYY